MTGNSKEWFNSAVSERTNNRDKLFKKFKKCKLPLGQEDNKKKVTKLRKKLLKKRETTLNRNLEKNCEKS